MTVLNSTLYHILYYIKWCSLYLLNISWSPQLSPAIFDQLLCVVHVLRCDQSLPLIFIKYVNPAYERLTGYSAEEVIGKDATEMAKADRNKTDLHDTINNQLKKGKVRD